MAMAYSPSAESSHAEPSCLRRSPFAWLLCGDLLDFHLLNPSAPLANPEPPKQHSEIRIEQKLLDNYTGRYQFICRFSIRFTNLCSLRFTGPAFAKAQTWVQVAAKFYRQGIAANYPSDALIFSLTAWSSKLVLRNSADVGSST
jgi:hypothetical protein